MEPTEREQFEVLVRRGQAAVCAVAYARLRDRARSEEVAQEAFLVAWLRRGATPPSVGWVCGIARNLARNAARRSQEVQMTAEPSSRDPRDELIERERAAHTEAALARLPERYREAVVLYYRGDESHAEVAGALGISETAARQRVHRGRAKLREALVAVEATLRATRPSAAFAAAVIAAWSTRGHEAAAATGGAATTLGITTYALFGGIAAGALAVTATVLVVARSGSHGGPAAVPAIAARFPAQPGAAHPGPFVLAARALPVLPAISVGRGDGSDSDTTVNLTVVEAPVTDIAMLLGEQLQVPVWIDPALRDEHVDLAVEHTEALRVLDDMLDHLHARRDEIAAIRLVESGGRTDAAALGGDRISVELRDAPLSDVLALLEPPLHQAIGGSGRRHFPGDDQPERHVSVVVRDAPAGVALGQILDQLHLGYEPTTGFAITRSDQ